MNSRISQQLEVIVNATTGVKALASNLDRTYLFIYNITDQVIFFRHSIEQENVAEAVWIPIDPKSCWEPVSPPTNEIWIKSTSGAPTVYVFEGVKR